MNAEQFDETLSEFKHREPFQPFVVELLDGTTIYIDEPSVAFCYGRATFFSAEYELIEFRCEQVRSIRPAVPGATA